LSTLNAEKLVLDWRKRQQSRAAVRLCIEDYLDQLPDAYDRPVFEEAVKLTYQHVYDMYTQTALVG
jgi:type I restriction enzyme, R subunit